MLYEYVMTSIETQFDCVRILKEGPRSRVYLVRHKDSGREMIFRRFQGSGEVYHKLLHVKCKYLPQIYEVAEHNGEVLVLEEYIPGDTLAFLLECSVLSPAQVRKIGRQLTSALWILHSLDAVHRDVKPDNVILHGDDVILIDFDASRMYTPGHTQDTQVLGTIGYAAPEQFGLAQTDVRSDIYSTGVLLNVLLTGTHPSVKLANGRFGRIIQRCTATNPLKRYQTIEQLIRALH